MSRMMFKTVAWLACSIVFLAVIAFTTTVEVRGGENRLPAVLTYPGREATAPWRKAAAQRIDKLRKGDLNIRVLNADGTPTEGAAVEVRMTRQAFPFATAVSSSMLVRRKGPDADRYRDMVDKLFTHVTIEYETCQIPWESNHQVALDAIKWLREHGKYVHGCHILWPHISDGLPERLVAAKTKPDEVRRLVMAHVDEKLNACKGQVREWNALNELHTNRFFQESLGDEEGKRLVVETFRRAKQIDPSLRLAVNDFGDMANPSREHIDGYLAWIRYLKEQRTAMDVVGLQCHFSQILRAPDDCMAMLDRFAAFGYPLHASELDINLSDEAVQADYQRDIMTVLYSHPAVEKITLWGFWEGRHWLPEAALWRTDWTIKPNGLAWMDLVFRQWRTNAALKTDHDGATALRAFLGDYEVTATYEGKSISRKVSLPSGGTTVELKLPAG